MRSRHLIAVIAVVVLSGCSPSNESEIRQWMVEVRQSLKPVVQPVPVPKRFTPHTFAEVNQTDPFDLQKVMPASAHQSMRAGAGAKMPDLGRRREVLEGYALDQLRMVGVMKQDNVYVALIDVDGATFLARVGSHVGQNFGRVTKISETELQLLEVTQDAAGEWVERPAKLELQESVAQQRGGKR
jgi:type IV pilus assembly protein PilP